jgi:hypothetical protein
MAVSTLRNNEFVNPPRAETTTTGREFTASLPMATTLRIASASSTEVPPNFMIVGCIK